MSDKIGVLSVPYILSFRLVKVTLRCRPHFIFNTTLIKSYMRFRNLPLTPILSVVTQLDNWKIILKPVFLIGDTEPGQFQVEKYEGQESIELRSENCNSMAQVWGRSALNSVSQMRWNICSWSVPWGKRRLIFLSSLFLIQIQHRNHFSISNKYPPSNPPINNSVI